uniref:Jacalin-type lectin domain-containing protein n=1 Tax=Phytophthora ramorum TaxID=164328 RepID=H3GUT5_PHYRM
MKSRAIMFMCQVLVMLALAARSPVAAEYNTETSEIFGGGSHGALYSDTGLVFPGQKVYSIIISAAERVDGVGIQFSNREGARVEIYHGGDGGERRTYELGSDEHITRMEAHWGKHHGHTRIKYISFTTSAGNTFSGGTQTDNVGKVTAPAGYQLTGFIGSAADEIDSVGAVWTIIAAPLRSLMQ